MKRFRKTLNVLSKITSRRNLTYDVIEKISISSISLIELAKLSGLNKFFHTKCNKRPSLTTVDYLLMSLVDIKLFSSPHNEKFSPCKFFSADNGCELYNRGVGIPTICRKRFLTSSDNKYIVELDSFLARNKKYLSNIIELLGGFSARRN